MDLIAIIENFGFPIACIIALGVFIKNMWQNQIETNDKLLKSQQKTNDKIMDELKTVNRTNCELVELINDKLDKISDKLDKLDKDKDDDK